MTVQQNAHEIGQLSVERAVRRSKNAPQSVHISANVSHRQLVIECLLNHDKSFVLPAEMGVGEVWVDLVRWGGFRSWSKGWSGVSRAFAQGS
ncbi:hypothetical protein ACIQI7_26930 [Kitasatospora sp. NPDC092039]|uniref:hypothetical protein n=1 Tax=Kitasatospora sp. NPDC092039 TaxID=3364086 RepID=UPI003814A1EC